MKGIQELVKEDKNIPQAALKDIFLPSGKGVTSQGLNIISRNLGGIQWLTVFKVFKLCCAPMNFVLTGGGKKSSE